jgi:hypothetical protein
LFFSGFETRDPEPGIISGGKMKKITLTVTALIATILLASCAGVITLKTPAITGGKAPEQVYTPKKPPVKFEDFEAGTIVGGYFYANGAIGATAKINISTPGTDVAHAGNYAARADFNAGTSGDWGCGFGFQSVYGGGYVDAKDREYLDLWIKAPRGLKFYIFVNEAMANGADGEYWNSNGITGAGDWKEYIIPMDTFFKNIYSGNQFGNNTIDMSGIGTVGAQIDAGQGAGTILIDDVYFK